MEKILPKTSKNPHGFTLIELLIVISIIAILAAIGMTIFGNVQKSARDARRRADLKSIQTALEVYKASTGTYPISTGLGSSGNGWIDSADGDDWFLALNSYISSGKVPKDPKNNGWFWDGTPSNPLYSYSYYSGSNTTAPAGSFYALVVAFENPTADDLVTTCTRGGYTFFYNNGTHALNSRVVCNQQ